jgi:hypothetical protein
MSTALHELTITILKRQHDEAIDKLTTERNHWLRKFLDTKAENEAMHGTIAAQADIIKRLTDK